MMLEIIRDVLVAHMDSADAVPNYRVQRALLIGKSGRLISENALTMGHDTPVALRLTMRSGEEFDLTLSAYGADPAPGA